MWKTLILIVGSAVASALAPLALAQEEDQPDAHRGSGMFERWDTNSDGVVTRAEVEAGAAERARKHFDSLDVNGDGKLTKDEVQQVHDRLRSAMHEKSEERFRSADTDGNGSLSKEEVERAMPQIGRQFERLDADKDGVLSAEELASMKKHREGRRSREE
jgi:Ca2+-binding EF-hand superfamily protein